MDELLGYAPPGTVIETRVITGDVVRELLAIADDEGADLLVVGTHGPNMFERLFVGSVAASLLHLSRCSVLASPPPRATEKARLEPRLSGTTVIERPAHWGPVRHNGGHTLVLFED